MQINVVHGVEVMGNEFPFMAALGYENEDNNTKYLCGGTLISSNFVLTAGHCIINVNDNKPVEVIIKHKRQFKIYFKKNCSCLVSF